MDPLEFLDGQPPAENAAAPEPAAPEAPAATPEAAGQPRAPDGKFAPKAEAAPAADPQAPAITPEAAQQPADPQRAPEGFVPLAALQAERDKRRHLEQQFTPPVPTPTLQPGEEGFEDEQAYIEGRVASEAFARYQVGLHYASLQYGEDKVAAVDQWARERVRIDPALRATAMSQIDPVAFFIREYDRAQVFERLGEPGVLERITAFLGGQAAAPAAAPAVVPASPQSPTPPRSLASVPNAGGAKPGAVPSGPGAAFDAVFKD
jgi:hypothetical protein